MAGKFSRTAVTMMVAAGTLFGAFSMSAATAPGAAAQSGAGMQSGTDTHIRVLHASPDAPAVDVYVNGNKAISDLAFSKISPWATLPAGSYDIKVTAAGQTAAVIEAKLPLEAGKYYTVAAVGKLANIKPQVVMDDLSALEAGKARLRVVHASADTPAVDVAVKGGPVLISNLAFPKASDAMAVDAGTVDVEVRPTGTTTAALSVPGFQLESGKVYTVYAIGLSGGTPALTVMPVVDSAAAPTMSGEAAMSGEAMQPANMPNTGSGENLSALAVLSLMLLALATAVGGALVRVRSR